MTSIVIPVKRLSEAKVRLMGVLSPDERHDLVLAMLTDLLAAVTAADCGRVLIVASDDAVFDIGHQYHADFLPEQDVQGYNAAVSKGMAWVNQGNICVLPGDMPLATPDEIACLCAPADVGSRCIRLAASHDRMGTNGLFQASHDLILPGFGVNSFVRHQHASRAAGIAPTLLDAPGMARDIDRPSDLAALAHCHQTSATRVFYESVREKLTQSELSKGVA